MVVDKIRRYVAEEDVINYSRAKKKKDEKKKEETIKRIVDIKFSSLN